MRNKWIYIIIVCLIIGASIGLYCVSSKEKEDVLVTKEYLIEACGFSEKDYAGINLYDFIKAYQLTEKKVNRTDVKSMFEEYKQVSSNVYHVDALFYEYLYTSKHSKRKLKEEDLEQIKVIALYINQGVTGNESIIVDYTKEEIYYGHSDSLLLDGALPKQTISLSDKRKETINEMWGECNILSWKRDYEDMEKDISGYYIWEMFIELESGEIKTYRGFGQEEKVKPDGFEILVDTLNQWNVKLVSTEYLRSNMGWTYRDVEGIDLEQFILENGITYERFFESEISRQLEQYKENYYSE